MSCVIFGAGKIARGFIGHLMYLSGIPFTFVEKADSLADLINERGSYYVNILGNKEKSCHVRGVQCLKYSEEEKIVDAIAGADAVFNAVGGKNLGELVGFYTKGIEKRASLGTETPINFVTCENWKKPADILREGIAKAIRPEVREYFDTKVGITEAVILRSGIDATEEQKARDPLWVNVQDYWHLHVDSSRLAGELPEIMGLHLIPEFGGFLERKFYTYNAANGTTSFVGALLGYQVLSEAATDERIVKLLEGVYSETSRALCKKYGFTPEEQFEFTRGSLNKLQNKVIVDTIERNARDPLRKLGPDDRLVGSAKMVEAYGIRPDSLATAIAAAVYYDSDNAQDPSLGELKTLRETKGIGYILQHVSKLEPGSALFQLVMEKAEELAGKGYIPADYLR